MGLEYELLVFPVFVAVALAVVLYVLACCVRCTVALALDGTTRSMQVWACVERRRRGKNSQGKVVGGG